MTQMEAVLALWSRGAIAVMHDPLDRWFGSTMVQYAQANLDKAEDFWRVAKRAGVEGNPMAGPTRIALKLEADALEILEVIDIAVVVRNG